MEMHVWLEDRDIEMIAEENHQSEEEVLLEISAEIEEYVNKKWGVLLSIELTEG